MGQGDRLNAWSKAWHGNNSDTAPGCGDNRWHLTEQNIGPQMKMGQSGKINKILVPLRDLLARNFNLALISPVPLNSKFYLSTYLFATEAKDASAK